MALTLKDETACSAYMLQFLGMYLCDREMELGMECVGGWVGCVWVRDFCFELCSFVQGRTRDLRAGDMNARVHSLVWMMRLFRSMWCSAIALQLQGGFMVLLKLMRFSLCISTQCTTHQDIQMKTFGLSLRRREREGGDDIK